MWTKNFVLNCFVLLSFVAWIQCSVTDDLACFEFIKRPTTQEVLPSSQGVLPDKTETVELYRHHVIPFQFLRTFFNFIATANVDATLRTYIDQEVRHLVDSYVGSPNLIPTELAKRIRATTDRDTVVNAMQVFYSWLPGNIFYGPKPELRSDDPGSAFEVDCYEVIGDKNYKLLGNLYIQMANFVDNAGHRNIDIFRSILTDLLSLFTRRTPFAYNKNQWEEDPNKPGKYRMRRAEREDKLTIPKQPTVAAGTACIVPKLIDIVTKPIVDKFVK